jgi:hypothetical protein
MISTLNKNFPAVPRRAAIRIASGGALGLMLAACGGGGGDSSSGDAQALRDAFSKLRSGMNSSDVEALVGFNANSQRTSIELVWVIDSVRLYVGFRSTDDMLISSASLREGSSPAQTKQFD